MPVRSKRFPSNGIYEGKITGLDESEKEALENAGVGGNVDGKDISPKNVSVSGKLTINSSSDIEVKTGSKVNHVPIYITPPKDEDEDYLIPIISTEDEDPITYLMKFEDAAAFVSLIPIVLDSYVSIGGLQSYDNILKLSEEGITYTYYTPRENDYPEEHSIIIDKNHIPVYEQNIAEKLPKIYCHFITLKGNGTDYIICFNAYTKDNAPIASLNDLYSKLPNTYFMCNGKADTLVPYAIHIGTSASDTTITGDGTISISSFTIVTDNVTETN